MLFSVSRLALVLAFAQLGLATPSLHKRWDDFSVKHSWVEVPRGWQLHSEAPADYRFDLKIALKQDKFEELVEALYEVSDPAHSRYGEHLTKEEVDALVAPHPETSTNVEEWLSYHGLTASPLVGSFITIPGISVAQAERLLDTKYAVYYHPDSDAYAVRTTSYSIPSSLQGHVDLVAPTTYFGNMKSLKTNSFLQPEIPAVDLSTAAKESSADAVQAAVPSSCNSTITPACLRALYNTVNYVPKGPSASNNTLGVAGYLDEYANRADLQTFFSRFRTDAVGATFKTVLVNNGKDDQSDPGVEANLDIQYTEGISYPTPNIYYSTGGSPPYKPDSQTPTNTNEPYLDWLNYVLSQSTLPQTFTTSYGDDEQTVPLDYAITTCNLFAQLGARGSSVLFSSGDFGVGGGDCLTNDGTNTKKFQPAFPASCPYVTAVGGTTKVTPEVAVSFSGGGFSNYFARPSYQSAAVSSFVTKLGTKFTGLYNTTGRAYPDIAAQGSGFQVVIGGRVGSVGGTSASCPTVAAIVALLNDDLLSKGKKSLGFLNPLLYSTGASALNDIVSGSNPGCGTTGFTAGTGWDPVTGLGTPDFIKLQAVVNA